MKISLILPTRNRHDNLRRLFQSLIDTTHDLTKLEISMRVDEDDNTAWPVIGEFQELDIRIIVGPRSNCYGDYWNDAWKNASGEIYMMLGNDFVFRTKDWDQRIREEFMKYDDRILFVFGEDGLQHGNIGTHGFIHKNWTDITGYFAAPMFNVYYHDTWNDSIAKAIGRRVYIPELYFEHMHHDNGKAVYDTIYQEMMSKTGNDAVIWKDTSELRSQTAEKLKQFIESRRTNG